MGVAGFCMGGGFALLYAARAPLGAAATFYGDVPKRADDLRGVCPIVAGYGGRDRIFAEPGRRLDRLLAELDVERDVVHYPDAGHSYMNRHTGLLAHMGAVTPMRAGYDEAAAEDSWRRMLAFFARHLDAAPEPGDGR
jgi:carboxymethylenebutenolidase